MVIRNKSGWTPEGDARLQKSGAFFDDWNANLPSLNAAMEEIRRQKWRPPAVNPFRMRRDRRREPRQYAKGQGYACPQRATAFLTRTIAGMQPGRQHAALRLHLLIGQFHSHPDKHGKVFKLARGAKRKGQPLDEGILTNPVMEGVTEHYLKWAIQHFLVIGFLELVADAYYDVHGRRYKGKLYRLGAKLRELHALPAAKQNGPARHSKSPAYRTLFKGTQDRAPYPENGVFYAGDRGPPPETMPLRADDSDRRAFERRLAEKPRKQPRGARKDAQERQQQIWAAQDAAKAAAEAEVAQRLEDIIEHYRPADVMPEGTARPFARQAQTETERRRMVIDHLARDEYRRCLIVKDDPGADPDDRKIARHTVREYEDRMKARPRQQQVW